MQRFITYFDYLGFKEFIENNDPEYQNRVMNQLFVSFESALSLGKRKESVHKGGYVSDLSDVSVNCINFSDTVIYFTKDTSQESFEEILEITYKFNWQANLFHFPVRGCLTIGELSDVGFNHTSSNDVTYNINSVYGKGLINAYQLAESQEWAGTIIDPKIEQSRLVNMESTAKFTSKYNVPFKKDKFIECNAFNLNRGGLNETAYKNFSEGIEENFSRHNKDASHPSAILKLKNTLEFLSSFKTK